MPLRRVPRAPPPNSRDALLRIAVLLFQASGLLRAGASLPPGAEDEIILIEHLPGRRVHLQDFFWTGPEDAPPWVDPSQGLTFYETRTVHHTVTIYSPAGEKDAPSPLPPAVPRDPECTGCIEPTPRLDDDEDQNIGVLVGEDPGPRYWLLTVLRAGEAVPPKVELRLARLYRAAFSRQQQRHLGLLSTYPRSPRSAKGPGTREDTSIVSGSSEGKPADDSTAARKSSIQEESKSRSLAVPGQVKMIEVSKLKRTLVPIFEPVDSDFASLDEFTDPGSKKLSDSVNQGTTTPVDPEERTNDQDRSSPSRDEEESKNRESPGEMAEREVSSKLRSLEGSLREVVQVRMQNTSVTEAGATRLIYSVHLGGKPVPAETAARDMALLSPQEVALELGAPVLIQSEPYLKESRPLALSRKRDAWLLIGAAGAGVILLALVLTGLIIAAKRKRAHSAVAAPPNRSILKKEREYVATGSGLDNAAFSTSETEVRTDGTSQRQTGSLSRTPVTPETPDSLDGEGPDVSSGEEEESKRKARATSPWDMQEHPQKRSRLAQGRISRTNAIDRPRTPDSVDTVDRMEALESLENGYARQEEATASPHSYLSMPSCKQFPNMRSVEPLSRVLEPVMVRHLDIDSPEPPRRDNGHATSYHRERPDDKFLARAPSATRDPGVVGPIVWSLRKQGASTEGNGTSETELETGYLGQSGPVGRARRRLHELLEDSFSLFGTRESRVKEPQPPTRPSSAAHSQDPLSALPDRRSSAHSPVRTPEVRSRPRTSLPRRGFEEDIAETGGSSARARGVWGSRPLSAGPFHRPALPEVDVRRILTEGQLPPEDPAVPLIASIKKELEKFSPQ